MCIGPECPGIQTPVIIPSRSNSKEEGPAPAPVAPRAICQEIVPDAGHTYIGAFPFPGDEEHVLTEAAISGFETMAGINDVGVDIGLRYLLMGMQGFSFPTADAQVMANPSRQGALFLKLEPWSPPGPDGRRGQEFTLAEIARGEHDERLRALAIQIRDFGGPVFFSFAHEMNFPEDSWYPWQGNPQEYIAAYRHVYELMSSITCNTTWVWNPGADSNYQTMMQYFPGERYVDWVALDGYDPRDQESAAPRRSFAETYDGLISALQPLNIPIMIGEFGSATFSNEDSTSRQPTYLTEAIDYIATTHERYTNPISAFVYFNTVSQTDEGIEMDWRITSPESQAALRTALDSHGEMFSGNIVTAPRDIAVSGLMRETNPIERFHTGEGQEATQWADHGDVSLQVPAAPGDFVAGLGVNLDNFIPPVGANTLEFNIRGNFASEGDYGHIVVQVFREGDDPGQNPASSIEIHNLTAGLTDYSVPLGTDTRPITKIQFLYVANGRGAEFEVTDLRFTASRPIPGQITLESVLEGEPYRFNAEGSQSQGSYTFNATSDGGETVAGLGMMIQDDFSPADSVNALALQLRGGITGDGEYGNIEIQIYRSDDSDDSVEDQPSTTHRLEGVTADFSDVYINLREDDQEVNNIRKIQILYIANGRSCQLELRNIRFEPHDFTIRPDAPVAPPEIPVTSSINPRIEAGFQNVCGFGYLGRTCELQFYANGLIPLRSWQGQRLTREINTLSLTAGEQVDTLEDVFGNPHTSEVTYLGLQYDLGWGSRDNRYSLTLRTDFGIGPFPLETLQPQFNDQALLRAEAYFWSQYAEAGFSAKIHHRYRGLDTYHFSAHGSLASVNPPYSNLRIGITGDHYYFPYMGRFQERWQGGFDFRYDLPIQLGRRARLTLRADLSPYAFITRTPDGNTWGAGIRAGIRALLDLPRGFGLELRYYYQTDATIGQPNTRFEQHDIEALLTYEF